MSAIRFYKALPLLLCILLTGPNVLTAKPLTEVPTDLPELGTVLVKKDLWTAKVMWISAIVMPGIDPSDKHQKLSNNKDVLDDLNSYISKAPLRGSAYDELHREGLPNPAYVVQYKKELTEVFSDFHRAGTIQAQFVYEEGEVPVRVALRNGKRVVVIKNLVSKTIYNTARETSKDRASKAIQEVIVPSAERFCKPFYGHDSVPYVGMTVLYGSKDFTKPDSIANALNLKSEAVALVTDVVTCRKLADGEITQEEFIQKADIFLSDRDTPHGGKKISLTF